MIVKVALILIEALGGYAAVKAPKEVLEVLDKIGEVADAELKKREEVKE